MLEFIEFILLITWLYIRLLLSQLLEAVYSFILLLPQLSITVYSFILLHPFLSAASIFLGMLTLILAVASKTLLPRQKYEEITPTNPFQMLNSDYIRHLPLIHGYSKGDFSLLTEIICHALVLSKIGSSASEVSHAVHQVLTYNRTSSTQLLHKPLASENSFPVYKCAVLIVIFMADWMNRARSIQGTQSLIAVRKRMRYIDRDFITDDLSIFCNQLGISVPGKNIEDIAASTTHALEWFLTRKVNRKRLREQLMQCFPGLPHLKNLLSDLQVDYYRVLGQEHETYHLDVLQYFIQNERVEDLVHYARAQCNSLRWDEIYD
jgi:hypothetical protein